MAFSEDWWKIIVGGIITLAVLLLGGGAMGKAVITTLRTMITAFVEQNNRLIIAVEANTKKTSELTASIQLDIEMQKQYNREAERQLDKIEKSTMDSSKGTHELIEATKQLIQSNVRLVNKFEGRV